MRKEVLAVESHTVGTNPLPTSANGTNVIRIIASIYRDFNGRFFIIPSSFPGKLFTPVDNLGRLHFFPYTLHRRGTNYLSR